MQDDPLQLPDPQPGPDSALFRAGAADVWPGGAVRLTDWGLIRARGADTVSFLQGQLTNDLSRLAPDQARLAGYCSPKGRLIASFVVWRIGTDDWLLACSADLLPQTLKRLSMFVMRAKCQLSDASADWSVWGLSGSPASSWLGESLPAAAWAVTGASSGGATGPCTVRLPDALGQWRCLHIRPGAAAAPPSAELPIEVWRWLEVASGVVRITAPTVDAFVPQMVNFELVGGVDFQKGCYPGQEVVARSQYRGTLKRRAVLLGGDGPMAVGQEIFHDADPGQPAGQVALAAGPGPGPASAGYLALVELKRAALLHGGLHLGAADGPLLHPLPLPYALPRDEADAR